MGHFQSQSLSLPEATTAPTMDLLAPLRAIEQRPQRRARAHVAGSFGAQVRELTGTGPGKVES